MSNRLQSGVNTLQGFREDKRNRVTQGTLPLQMFRHDANVRALLPAGGAFLFSRADVSASHSVLHQLRALHLLRSHLRLQLCQHQQGGVRPHLLFLRRRVQSAGLRQVCAATTHSRSVAFTQNVTRHSWPTAFPDASVFY